MQRFWIQTNHLVLSVTRINFRKNPEQALLNAAFPNLKNLGIKGITRYIRYKKKLIHFIFLAAELAIAKS